MILVLMAASALERKARECLGHISPVRAILSSVFALAVLCFLQPNATGAFISDFRVYGFTLLSYGLLNVFADSLSLLETRTLLRWAISGSIARFFGLVLLDLAASAIIFLAIPLSTGNAHVFAEAVFFRGTKPWLGILFWSTFFTSLLLYLYLISSAVLAIFLLTVRGYSRLEGILPVTTRPIRCLGLVAMSLVTLVFIIMAIV